ncbi:hypothetical protein M9H77_12561 [Catharanthus roseus]|uniref:Uncharacterized protein n=1 Tax=Catharanthus roseus TaxID=4058 RepID=A0ACC0BHU7_CATRO|nr:hypothetical protein M9H77_12561 [Catharanthus roseus]
MVRLSGHRGDDDLGPITDKTGRVQSRTITASSRGMGGHSTSALSSTPTPLPASLHHDTGAPESRPPLPSHLSHTPVPYEAYGFAHPHSQPSPAVYDPYLVAPTVRPHIPYRSLAQEPLIEFSMARQLWADFFEQMVGAVQPDSSYSTHGYTVGDYSVSSPEPFMRRQYADLRFEGDRGLGEEPNRVRSLHIGGEEDERVDDGGDGDGDDDDDGEDVGDEEQPVPLALVAPASGSDGRPRHGKGKGLTGSFMSVMNKISGSRNKRPNKARDVLAPTQRKRVNASNWEQTGPTEGGPVDRELIPSYGGMWQLDMAWRGSWFIEVSIMLHGTYRVEPY